MRLCCLRTHAGGGIECDDGKVMCDDCFERFEQAELYVDADGQKWNICKPCAEAEASRAAQIPGTLDSVWDARKSEETP